MIREHWFTFIIPALLLILAPALENFGRDFFNPHNIKLVNVEFPAPDSIKFDLKCESQKYSVFKFEVAFDQDIDSVIAYKDIEKVDVTDSCLIPEPKRLIFKISKESGNKSALINGEYLRFYIKFKSPLSVPDSGYQVNIKGDSQTKNNSLYLFRKGFKNSYNHFTWHNLFLIVLFSWVATRYFAYRDRKCIDFTLEKFSELDDSNVVNFIKFLASETLEEDVSCLSFGAEYIIDRLIGKKAFIKKYIAPIERTKKPQMAGFFGRLLPWVANEAFYIRTRNKCIREIQKSNEPELISYQISNLSDMMINECDRYLKKSKNDTRDTKRSTK